MKTKLLSVLTIGAMVFLMSCKGKDGAPGPAGATGATGSTGTTGPAASTQNYTSKEGFVKGTATGTNLDGTTYSYNIDFEGISSSTDNNYVYLSPTRTNIQIYKIYSGEGDAFLDGVMHINFDVPDMNSLSSPTNAYYNFDAKKDLGNNKYKSFSQYGTTSVTNLIYNSSTGILTGNYTISEVATSSYGSLNIANGTFSTKLSNEVLRKGVQ
jgi:hypothetical protein